MRTPEEVAFEINDWFSRRRSVEDIIRSRDAEIRRDTIEKAKDLLRNAARDDGDSPRETLTQYLSGYRDGRQSCSARVVAALDSLRDGKE